MTAYYNEIDPYAAAWLRNLIEAGHIAPGVVDERSIEDVRPEELAGFIQCHFFAGIGVWSHALRRAGWPDDRPVWTGSCPCQPFSAAGKGAGFDDQRHLWPHFHYLISQCQPAIVLGEQVASSDSGPWIDLVHTDLEALGYAFGAVPFPSAGIGAPHIRDRLYWVANATYGRRSQGGRLHGRYVRAGHRSADNGIASGLEHSDQPGREPGRWDDQTTGHRATAQPTCEPRRLADPDGGHAGAERKQRSGEQRQQPEDGVAGRLGHADSEHETPQPRVSAGAESVGARGGVRPGPTNGLWRDADWLACRDGKWRPVEPGTFPLAHGAPARVGRLRAYGNAINAEAARVFIKCVIDTLDNTCHTAHP